MKLREITWKKITLGRSRFVSEHRMKMLNGDLFRNLFKIKREWRCNYRKCQEQTANTSRNALWHKKKKIKPNSREKTSEFLKKNRDFERVGKGGLSGR